MSAVMAGEYTSNSDPHRYMLGAIRPRGHGRGQGVEFAPPCGPPSEVVGLTKLSGGSLAARFQTNPLRTVNSARGPSILVASQCLRPDNVMSRSNTRATIEAPKPDPIDVIKADPEKVKGLFGKF
jgi:hypothetical protein